MLKGRLAKATLSYSLQRQALVLQPEGLCQGWSHRSQRSTQHLLPAGSGASGVSLQLPEALSPQGLFAVGSFEPELLSSNGSLPANSEQNRTAEK